MNIVKRSLAWTIDRDKFALLVRESDSIAEIMRKLGFAAVTGNTAKSVKQRIQLEGIDCTHFGSRPIPRERFARCRPLDEALVENSNYSRKSLKRRLIEEGRLDNKCAECGLDAKWNGKPLVLRLDHINGVNNDNREDNLRLLCPNCDSQQPTFSGANWKREKKLHYCIDCKTVIFKKSLRCAVCDQKKQEKIAWPTPEELSRLVLESNRQQVANTLGVSWNAVNKRMQRHPPILAI